MNVELSQLWLPIVLSAVFVFLVSSIVHMVLQVHKHDYKPLPNEGGVTDALRSLGVAPGAYVFPACTSMKDLGTAEMQQKFAQGPVGHLVIRPKGMPSMGKSLLQWFVFCIVVSVFIAYLGTLTIPAGTAAMRVFRITGTVAVLAYGVTGVMDSIWKGLSWGTALKFIGDGIAYGLATAATFAWLWPHAG